MKTIADRINSRTSNRLALIAVGITVSLGSLLNAQSTSPAKQPKQPAKTSTSGTGAAPSAQDPGERKFQANCNRCHTAPDQISPRIAGTIVRHMRVRASLSAEDERDILRYLAP
ncbi:MAG TPA: cytochrome c [Acidobacteriaceae bacterium]